MKLEGKLNSQDSKISNINNKKKASAPFFIDNLNIINRLNSENYKKINFATQSREFQKRAQPELNQLPYSPPVEKLLLPYTYHDDDLVSPSDIFQNNITIENNSPTKIKLENTPMKTSNSNAELINIDRKKNLISDFGINKIKQFFYNSIEKVQSTGKVQALVVKNKLNPRKEDIYNVKFYKKNGVSEIQKANKQNAEAVNEEKNPPISFSGKDRELFNQAKNLKNKIHELEKKMSSHKDFNKLDDKFKYTKSAQNLINECISSPSNKRDTKFSATIETMNGVINKLNNQLSSLKENEEKVIKHTSGKNMFNSNESLNSNSSGYQSDNNSSLGNSVCFSDDFPHQEKNKNIRLISENFSNLNKNEITDNKVNKTRLPEKEKNKTPKKLEQTQAEKMKQLTKGNSSTGYIHPSRRNKTNNSNKMEQIKQLNKKIAELEALKKEYQEMAIVTSTQEKQAAQLILKAKQGPVKSRKI